MLQNYILFIPQGGDASVRNLTFFFFSSETSRVFRGRLLESEMIIAEAGCVRFVVSAWMASRSSGQHSQPIN